MIRAPRLRVSWLHIKQYSAAFLAIVLIFRGIQDIVWPLRRHFINTIAGLANPIIEKYFVGHLLLAQYRQMPWRFEASYYIFGVIFIVVGVFFGLWAKVRIDRQPAP